EDIDYPDPILQDKIIQLEAQNCKNESSISSGWCPETWDGIMCWSSTAPGMTAVQGCPRYIAGFDFEGNATKQCMSGGQWYWSSELNSTWTNYTRCFQTQLVTVLVDLPDLKTRNNTSFEGYLPRLKTMSEVGYTVSLSALGVAFCIFASIRRLRSQKNILHMHLFVSFIARAVMYLLKDLLFVGGVGLAKNVVFKDGESYWLGAENNWHCKAFTVMWQYCILANYSWLLMEGIYLHNLIVYTLFAESDSSTPLYVLFGWGLPAIFITIWTILRVMYNDVLCWTIHDNIYIYSMIQGPITLSVFINAALFVNMVKILVIKFRAPVEESFRYKKFARSTLILVPLFGVHYCLSLVISVIIRYNETIEIVWLFCDQLFASLQGFVVSLLYCFLTGEVREEITRLFRASSLSRSGSRMPRSSFSCNGTGGSIHQTHPGVIAMHQTRTENSEAQQHHLQLMNGSNDTLHTICCCCCCCCRCWLKPRSSHSMASTQDIAFGTRGGSLDSSHGNLAIDVSVSGNNLDEPMLPSQHHLHHSESLQMLHEENGIIRNLNCGTVDRCCSAFCPH
ncbi:hypothetical protein QAD02_009151, partial [Eretmocerus hayati]